MDSIHPSDLSREKRNLPSVWLAASRVQGSFNLMFISDTQSRHCHIKSIHLRVI